MTNGWDVVKDSPYLAFWSFVFSVHALWIAWNRFLRHLNIRAHGWPPAHVDADGDFKKDED